MKRGSVQNKIVILSILGLFCAGAITGIWLTISEYRTFRDGESVQATVTHVRFERRRKGRTRMRLDTTLVLHGEEFRHVFHVPTRALSMGDIRLFGNGQGYRVGSVVEVLAVKNGELYEFAIADDALNPWTELGIFGGFLFIGVPSFVALAKRNDL